MPYRDLREYLVALEERGRLHHVKKEVDKDWEIAAVCRKVFQKIPEINRPALMFDNVRGFDTPVVVGVLGASQDIHALALESPREGIQEKWDRALANPLEPRIVATGPCKENVMMGADVDLNRFPVPIWTVGEDAGPYITSAYVCTRDPDTGVRNLGTYRLQVKARNKTGLCISGVKHITAHVRKNEERNRPTQVAIAIGTDPVVGLTSVAGVPFGVDEFAVAGALRGEPVDLVRCETVDLEAPATAEIVIEGEMPPHYRELEGPFGEHTGYMGPAGEYFVVDVKCITHRNKPIFQAFVSQMPPSESSCIRLAGHELPLLRHLRDVYGFPVHDLHLRESGAVNSIMVISLKKEYAGVVWPVVWVAWAFDPAMGKITIVVDEDIDVRDPFAVDWAMAYRMQPARDVHIVRDTPPVRLDPSLAPAHVFEHDRVGLLGSKMLIDATKKHAYPSVALPPREHLAAVEERWNDYGFK